MQRSFVTPGGPASARCFSTSVPAVPEGGGRCPPRSAPLRREGGERPPPSPGAAAQSAAGPGSWAGFEAMRSRSNSGVRLDGYARLVQRTILCHQVRSSRRPGTPARGWGRRGQWGRAVGPWGGWRGRGLQEGHERPSSGRSTASCAHVPPLPAEQRGER